MTEKRCFKTLQRGMTLIEVSVVLLVLVALAGLAVPYVGGIGSTAMCQTTDATMQAVKQAIMGGAGGAGFYGDMLGDYPKKTKGLTNADYNLTYLFSAPPDGSWGGLSSFNAKTGVGWRGPYLTTGGQLSAANLNDASFGDSSVFHKDTNPTGKVHINHNNTELIQVFDGWHRPIILQVPYYDDDYHPEYARLVSAGPGNGIEPSDASIDTPINDKIANNRNNGNYTNDDRVLFLRVPDPALGGNTPCNES
ncbi:MAG: prepilin-type N-terminal cleavage/methylation domain-containing protein [Methylobacter sp.]|nr:prepilin-type N-terminal cleavage/methylation domain-containing protein [Methylobacter sp.]MDP2099997.1 prepilin-type N-terminal cleavage/methylation domain-containing protein [Methylobacter sp.]MDP2427557.1 prepilin-type N-terminal cleavage/methylation domain-containing protein [Methylobacter sp.]MDP3054513.1 prepilin-type N-terminal cleavage/methylation domain-containing protein [Methylobacter sp.]MDP3362629.1 prepilin-type N-terminal cleavage/methylation domain-containing protein [Methylo